MKIIKLTDEECQLLRECLTYNYLDYKKKIDNKEKFDFQKEKLEQIKNLNSKILIAEDSKKIYEKLKGCETEMKAVKILSKLGYKVICQLDWICDDRYGNRFNIEVKWKEERFKKGKCGSKIVTFEDEGHGTDIKQIKARLRFQKETGMRAILLVYDEEVSKWYWQYIDELEKGNCFDTPKDIRIYPIKNFKVLK